MPVVTRSDCTQTNVKEQYLFLKDALGSISGVVNEVSLEFQSCQGANNKNNDLTAFVQQLVNDGKLSTTEQDIFKKRVIGTGSGKCEAARDELLAQSDFHQGYVIDDRWDYIVGKFWNVTAMNGGAG